MDLTFISLLRFLFKASAVVNSCKCVRAICNFARGLDWTRLRYWDQSCSEVSVDERNRYDTRCDRTIQASPSTFQQASSMSLS
jgi:hypothetical protein